MAPLVARPRRESARGELAVERFEVSPYLRAAWPEPVVAQSVAQPRRESARIALADTDRFDKVILASMRTTDQPVVAVIER